MDIDNFVVIRCEKGDILCRDMDDANITIACCDIQDATIEKYEFNEHWSCILKIIERERPYATV